MTQLFYENGKFKYIIKFTPFLDLNYANKNYENINEDKIMDNKENAQNQIYDKNIIITHINHSDIDIDSYYVN